MPSTVPGRVRRLLRSRGLITAELLGLALLFAVTTLVPQSDDDAPAAGIAAALGLDRVLSSAWFAAFVGLAAASLAVVLVDLCRRAARDWPVPPPDAVWAAAPLRVEFTRAAATPPAGTRASSASRGRAGTLGPAVFHLGLLLVVAAAMHAALFERRAAVDWVVGETLPPDPSAWAVQWGGVLAHPVALPFPVTLDRLDVTTTASGTLDRIVADLSTEAGEPLRLAINEPLSLGSDRLYASPVHGPAALVEVRGQGAPHALAVPLRADGRGTFSAETPLGDGLVLRLRSVPSGPAGSPPVVDARVMRGGALLFAGPLIPDAVVPVAPGTALALREMRAWIKVDAGGGDAPGVAFAGFALVIAGAVLMTAVVRVDSSEQVVADGGVERVRIAWRPHRFASLFREGFRDAVRTTGGPDEGEAA